VAVNLSAQEFRQRDVVKEVAQALADTGWTPAICTSRSQKPR
jgi:EAL domain-containing protein (putative c-di-GMP-specific phosphodiesterase class I)